MKKLVLSYANPDTWRTTKEDKTSRQEWKQIRLPILSRDDYTCQYCEFKADKWQIVHHIDGDPNNNKSSNLETICIMCNLIHHSGQGCIVQGIVDLYKKSKYTQNEIIQNTRKMRAKGLNDMEIIEFLGLKERVPFIMNRTYLESVCGFITSRETSQEWAQKALEYGYENDKEYKLPNQKMLDIYL